VLALYRDAFKQLPVMLKERARFQLAARVTPSVLGKAISKRFYRQGYAGVVLAEWTSRWHNLLRSSR